MQEVSIRTALRDERQNVKNQSGFVLPKTFAHFNRLFEAKRDPLLNV